MDNLNKIADELRINYDGIYKDENKMYAYTITSRKLYRQCEDFRRDLYTFLSSIKHKYAIVGAMEYHNKSAKVHCHCIGFCGNPPKGNKSNPFYIDIKPIRNLEGWISYILKSSLYSIEFNSEVRSGLWEKKQQNVCLFDSD